MTEKQKAFGRLLIAIMKDSELAMAVSILLKERNQMDMMAEYLAANVEGETVLVTNLKILEKARDIYEKTTNTKMERGRFVTLPDGEWGYIPIEKIEEWKKVQENLKRK